MFKEEKKEALLSVTFIDSLEEGGTREQGIQEEVKRRES